MNQMRIGQGWDSHRLMAGRALMLGGIAVPSELGEDGHSDGDVLLHALTDAILGAGALGDIGRHFPPSDTRWKDADSSIFLVGAISLLETAGWRPVNLDATILLERPRLAPHIDAIRQKIAALAGMDLDDVSVKAKTREGLDAVGRGEAIEAMAVVLVERAEG
ncbi:MAG: 2-C-methyl-D-erythritol 2,4-cyclodiphosphate synthase [Spirochaetota bacterium]